MSEKNKKSAPVVNPIPEDLPEELLPLYDWWKANGKQALITLAVVVVVIVGAFSIYAYRQRKTAEANIELQNANTLEELETAVAKHGRTKYGNAVRLRLGKAYYDAGRYEDALNSYRDCVSGGVLDGFKEIADLGIAFSLEALGKTGEALKAFQAFEKDNPKHYLLPEATMGVARVLTVQGKKADAKRLLENLKAKETGKTATEMKITRLEELIDRYQPRAKRSLFEAADKAALDTAKAEPAVTAPKAIPAPKAKPAAAPKSVPAPKAKPAPVPPKSGAVSTAVSKPMKLQTDAKPAPAKKPAAKPAPAKKPAAKPAPAKKPAAKPAPEKKPAAKPAPAAQPKAKK